MYVTSATYRSSVHPLIRPFIHPSSLRVSLNRPGCLELDTWLSLCSAGITTCKISADLVTLYFLTYPEAGWKPAWKHVPSSAHSQSLALRGLSYLSMGEEPRSHFQLERPGGLWPVTSTEIYNLLLHTAQSSQYHLHFSTSFGQMGIFGPYFCFLPPFFAFEAIAVHCYSARSGLCVAFYKRQDPDLEVFKD